jgi:fluoride exporter
MVSSPFPLGSRITGRETKALFALVATTHLLEQRELKMEYLWIALGSALGGVGRYWLSGVIARGFGEAFPIGTLVVNVTGSFLIGLVAALSEPEGRLLIHPTARQFVMAGILGGYTTFSSFSLQTLNLAREGEWLYAAANAVLSLVLCLLAVWLGHALAQATHR